MNYFVSLTRSSKACPAKAEVHKQYAEPTANETWYKKTPGVLWYCGKKEAGFLLKHVDSSFWFFFSSFWIVVGLSNFLVLCFVVEVKTVSGREAQIKIAASQMAAATNALQVQQAFEFAFELRKVCSSGNLYDTMLTPRDWFESLSGDKSGCAFLFCGLWIFKIRRFSIGLFSK